MLFEGLRRSADIRVGQMFYVPSNDADASRMRLDWTRTGDSASGWNAASAAAGPLMMLDSASTDLGYSAPK